MPCADRLSRFLRANWTALKIRWKARSGNCAKKPASGQGDYQRLGDFYPAPAWSTEFVYLYLATELIPGPTQLEADEAIELLHVPLAETIEMIQSGAITDGKTMAALLLAQHGLNS